MHFRADAPHSIDLTRSLSTNRFVSGGKGTLPYCASQSIGKSQPIESTIIPKDTCRSTRSIVQKTTADPSDATTWRAGSSWMRRRWKEDGVSKREGAGDQQGEGDGRHGRKRSDEEEEPLRAYARRFRGWTLESSCTGMFWGELEGSNGPSKWRERRGAGAEVRGHGRSCWASAINPDNVGAKEGRKRKVVGDVPSSNIYSAGVSSSGRLLESCMIDQRDVPNE